MTAANPPALARLAQRSKLALVLGIVCVIVGIVAIVVPAAASVAVAIFIGWVLVFGAIVQLFNAFSAGETARTILFLVLAVLMAAAGIYLLVAPLKGTITLTVVLAAWFIATGIMRLIAAWADRGTGSAGAMGVSGGISLILGLLVALNLPSSADWAIGLLVGVDFLVFGWVLIVLSRGARKAATST